VRFSGDGSDLLYGAKNASCMAKGRLRWDPLLPI